MPFYYTHWILLPLLSALVNGALAIHVWRRRCVPAAAWLFWVMVGMSGWSLSYALNTAASELWLKNLFFKCGTSFVCLLLVTVLPMTITAMGQSESTFSRLKLAILGVVPLISTVMVWTNDYNGLTRSSLHLINTSGLWLLGYTDGPYFHFHILYVYLYYLVVIILCLRGILTRGQKRRSSLGLIIIATLIPLTTDMLGLSPIKGLHLATSSLFITGLCYWWAVARHHLLDLVPIARETLFEEMSEPVLVVDPQGRLAASNRAAKALFGLKTLSAGLELATLFPSGSPLHALAATEHNGLLQDIQTGCTWHISRKELLHNNESQGSLIVMRDISTLQLFQEELKESQQHLSEALAAERKTRKVQERFLDMISHEYRTPLAIIQTNIDIMKLKEQKVGHNFSGSLHKIQQAVGRLVDIFEGLRRREGLERGMIDPVLEKIEAGQFFKESLSAAADFWGERFICLSDPPPECILYADRRQLRTVLLNLLDNAVKYSPPDTPISVNIRRSGAVLEISIRNRSAMPLPDDTVELFKKYSRGSNSAGTSGTGVGLYLAHGILEQHGGGLKLAVDETGEVVAMMRLPLNSAPERRHVA